MTPLFIRDIGDTKIRLSAATAVEKTMSGGYILVHNNCQKFWKRLFRCIKTPQSLGQIDVDSMQLPLKTQEALAEQQADDWARSVFEDLSSEEHSTIDNQDITALPVQFRSVFASLLAILILAVLYACYPRLPGLQFFLLLLMDILLAWYANLLIQAVRLIKRCKRLLKRSRAVSDSALDTLLNRWYDKPPAGEQNEAEHAITKRLFHIQPTTEPDYQRLHIIRRSTPCTQVLAWLRLSATSALDCIVWIGSKAPTCLKYATIVLRIVLWLSSWASTCLKYGAMTLRVIVWLCLGIRICLKRSATVLINLLSRLRHDSTRTHNHSFNEGDTEIGKHRNPTVLEPSERPHLRIRTRINSSPGAEPGSGSQNLGPPRVPTGVSFEGDEGKRNGKKKEVTIKPRVRVDFEFYLGKFHITTKKTSLPLPVPKKLSRFWYAFKPLVRKSGSHEQIPNASPFSRHDVAPTYSAKPTTSSSGPLDLRHNVRDVWRSARNRMITKLGQILE